MPLSIERISIRGNSPEMLLFRQVAARHAHCLFDAWKDKEWLSPLWRILNGEHDPNAGTLLRQRMASIGRIGEWCVPLN